MINFLIDQLKYVYIPAIILSLGLVFPIVKLTEKRNSPYKPGDCVTMLSYPYKATIVGVADGGAVSIQYDGIDKEQYPLVLYFSAA